MTSTLSSRAELTEFSNPYFVSHKESPATSYGFLTLETVKAKAPELVACFDRLISQTAYQFQGTGYALFAPTSFQKMALDRIRPGLAKALDGPILDVVVQKISPQCAEPAGRPSNASRSVLISNVIHPGSRSPSSLSPQNSPQGPSAETFNGSTAAAGVWGSTTPSRGTRVTPLPVSPSPSGFPAQTSLPLAPKSPSPKFFVDESLQRKGAPGLITCPYWDLSLSLLRRFTDQCHKLSNYGSQSSDRVIWVSGAPGSGKTALLKQLHVTLKESVKLRHVRVMDFFHEWRSSLDNHSHMSFARKYRYETDVLVLENLEDLQGKIKTQDEVADTISSLMERGASVAVSSSLPPEQMRDILSPSLFSRLFSGLSIELKAPDRVFKDRFWNHLLRAHRLESVPMDLMIQERIFDIQVDSVAKLQSLFLAAIIKLNHKGQLSMADLGELEHRHASQNKSLIFQSTNPKELIEKVCKACGVSVSAIYGGSKRADIVLARRFVCLALSRYLGLPNNSIAALMDKDPSTISYCLTTARKELDTKRVVAEQWNFLCSELGFKNLRN